jgi:hypothetical protein
MDQTGQVSEKLLLLGSNVLNDLARKGRSLSEVERWKATELRQFLMNTEILALKNILPDIMYDNFLCHFSTYR